QRLCQRQALYRRRKTRLAHPAASRGPAFLDLAAVRLLSAQAGADAQAARPASFRAHSAGTPQHPSTPPLGSKTHDASCHSSHHIWLALDTRWFPAFQAPAHGDVFLEPDDRIPDHGQLLDTAVRANGADSMHAHAD